MIRDHDFQEVLWQKGRELYRDMPWRQNTNPYFVLVSELMLQQTQVERVIPKFEAFTAQFPTVKALAAAPLGGVLAAWSGLGYNRRAKFLHASAQQIVKDYAGKVPSSLDELCALPGVGVDTAGAIMAYSFNQPALFVETNVRTVLFEHYFPAQSEVADRELRDVLGRIVDREHPREWYWAMMDYGSWLKRNGRASISASAHYKKQAPLAGSLREMRGLIMKSLVNGSQQESELRAALPRDERFDTALGALIDEGMVERSGEQLHLKQ